MKRNLIAEKKDLTEEKGDGVGGGGIESLAKVGSLCMWRMPSFHRPESEK